MDHVKRVQFKQWLKKNISFRFHMSFIMFSTIFLGIVSNFIMLRYMVLSNPSARYPLTVLLSYGGFLLIIRYYIKNILFRSLSEEALDTVDFAHDGHDVMTDADSGSGSDTAFSLGDVGDGEEGAIIVLVLGGAIAAIIFGSGVYFIWHSPEILSECLLQVLLVSGIRRRMRKFSEAEWSSHILKTTILPFLMVLVLSLILGLYMKEFCPDASTFQEYKNSCWGGR